MVRSCLLIIGCALGLTEVVMAQVESAAELHAQAVKAVGNQQIDQALALLDKALKEDTKHVPSYQLRARLQEVRGKFAAAENDLAHILEIDPKQADVYQQRGVVRFKNGDIKGSIVDFDKYLELRPEQKVSHWQRGISHYYAGRYDDGRQQFEGYQTFDSNDVENAVWRFMCMTRASGLEPARKAMLKIGRDTRVPMKEVYDLYLGKVKPDDVLAAAEAGKPPAELLNRQLFYAHLYIGIYHDLLGDKRQALDHLQRAADKHRIGHYMWDVARVHRDLLKKEADRK